MSETDGYTPGPAGGAEVRESGEQWTLVMVRKLRHSPEKVWAALTEPEQLKAWAPFDTDGSLGTTGAVVHLSTVARRHHMLRRRG